MTFKYLNYQILLLIIFLNFAIRDHSVPICVLSDRLNKTLSEGDARMRDCEEAADTKIRESQRKAKAEADEEWKERIKVSQ